MFVQRPIRVDAALAGLRNASRVFEEGFTRPRGSPDRLRSISEWKHNFHGDAKTEILLDFHWVFVFVQRLIRVEAASDGAACPS